MVKYLDIEAKGITHKYNGGKITHRREKNTPALSAFKNLSNRKLT